MFAVAALLRDPDIRPLAPILGNRGLFGMLYRILAPELPRAAIIKPLAACCPTLDLAPPAAVLGAPLGLGAPIPPKLQLYISKF